MIREIKERYSEISSGFPIGSPRSMLPALVPPKRRKKSLSGEASPPLVQQLPKSQIHLHITRIGEAFKIKALPRNDSLQFKIISSPEPSDGQLFREKKRARRSSDDRHSPKREANLGEGDKQEGFQKPSEPKRQKRSAAGPQLPGLHTAAMGRSTSLQRVNRIYESKLETFIRRLKIIHKALYSKRYETPIPRVFISYPWGVLKHENWVRKQLDPHLELLLGEENVILDEKNNRTNDIGRFIDLMNTADKVILVITPLLLEKYERGCISERLCVAIGLKESESKSLLADLRQANLIDQLGYFIWKDDMKLEVQRIVRSLDLPERLKPLKAKMIEQLNKIYQLYEAGNSAVIAQEISILNNVRARNLKNRGSVVLALLEGDARNMPPLLQSLPVVHFTEGIFTKTDLLNTVSDKTAFEGIWGSLKKLGYIDVDDEEVRITPVLKKLLLEDKQKLEHEFRSQIVEFLEGTPERTYPIHFLKIVEKIGISLDKRNSFEDLPESIRAELDPLLLKIRAANVPIFLSYSWINRGVADQIDEDFNEMGLELNRDIRNLHYKDSLTKKITAYLKNSFVIMLISKAFLKSYHCMHEVMEFIKGENDRGRFLPIMLQDLRDERIFEPASAQYYKDYWAQKHSELYQTTLHETAVQADEIKRTVVPFIKFLQDTIIPPLEELAEKGYKEILEEIDRSINTNARGRKTPLFMMEEPMVRNNLPGRLVPFLNREDILASMRRSFKNSSRDKLLICANTGAGGVGKTSLALEYAHKYSDEYNNRTFFVEADKISTLVGSYRVIGKLLDLRTDSMGDDEIIDCINGYFQKNTGWLLIFDNVSNSEIIDKYFPRDGGHILITSRNVKLKHSQFSVSVFNREVSIELIMRRTGNEIDPKQIKRILTKLRHVGLLNTSYHIVNADIENLLNEDHLADLVQEVPALDINILREFQKFRLAMELASLMGDLPIALEQASSYISKKEISFADYIELFHKHRRTLWNIDEDELGIGEKGRYPVYKKPITKELLRHQLQMSYDSAVDSIHQLIAQKYIDGYGYTTSLFEQDWNNNETHTFPDNILDLCKRIHVYANPTTYITLTISMEELGSLEKKILYYCSLIAPDQIQLEFLVRCIGADDVLNRAQVKHACHSLLRTGLLQPSNPTYKIHRLTQIAIIHTFECATELQGSIFDTVLGAIDGLFNYSRYDQKTWPSIQYLNHAVAIFENCYEQYASLHSIQKSQLIDVLLRIIAYSVQYGSAQTISIRDYETLSLELLEKYGNDDKLRLSKAFLLCGIRNLFISNYSKAKDYFDRVVKCYTLLEVKENEWEMKLYYAHSIHGLGQISMKQGQFEEAEKNLLKALKIRNGILESHIDLALSHENLGLLYRRKGKEYYKQSIQHHNEALKIWGLSFPDESTPSIAHSYHGLGSVLFEQGKYEEAEKAFIKVREIREKYFSPPHIYLNHAYMNLGRLYVVMGKAEAKDYFVKTISGWNLLPQDKRYPEIYVGDAYFNLYKIEKERKYLLRARETFGELKGETAKKRLEEISSYE